LWRWYYWQVDQPAMRRSTLEALATRLSGEADPVVRRGLQESLYDVQAAVFDGRRQNVNCTPSWIWRFAKSEVNPNGWLGEREALPCTLNVENPGSNPKRGLTTLFTLA
jgi:hypothetical protein